jgi:hypothetical protein
MSGDSNEPDVPSVGKPPDDLRPGISPSNRRLDFRSPFLLQSLLDRRQVAAGGTNSILDFSLRNVDACRHAGRRDIDRPQYGLPPDLIDCGHGSEQNEPGMATPSQIKT